MFLIYKHTNLENGMIYIGLTKQVAERRWRNGMGYKDNPYFFSAIVEYGWKHFSHEVIEENIPTKEEALKRENFWINYYDSGNPKKGYNVKNKKSLNKTRKKFEFQNEETRQKIRASAMKKVKCLETGEIFESLSAACAWMGLKQISSLSAHLHSTGGKTCGKHPQTKEKLHWQFI